jgi:hypothetical protein
MNAKKIFRIGFETPWRLGGSIDPANEKTGIRERLPVFDYCRVRPVFAWV